MARRMIVPMMVCIAALLASCKRQPPPPPPPVRPAVTLADLQPAPKYTPETRRVRAQYRVGKGYILMIRTDPKTGNKSGERITIDDALIASENARKVHEMIESKLLELGDQVVPELGEIMLYEDNPALLEQAAATLGKIKTDKAMRELMKYLKWRNVAQPGTQAIATRVIDIIGGCGRPDSTAMLRDIAANGATAGDKSEARKLLGETVEPEKAADNAGAESIQH